MRQNIKQKIQRFYDVSSPYIFKFWGPHIHDGYYVNGRESKLEAQENLIRLLATKANILRGTKIFDVGCGIGGTCIYLSKEFGAVTTGITISPVQIEMAKKLAQQHRVNCRFILGDAEKMNLYLKDNNFDIIWVLGAITHLTNQEKFLREATKFLNLKGKFIIGDWMVADGISNSEENKHINPILHGMLMPNAYSLNTYIARFIKYGYKIVYAEDITANTIKTWEVTLSIIRNPAIWELAYKEGTEFINFLKSIHAIKRAMQQGQMRFGVIVAEKI